MPDTTMVPPDASGAPAASPPALTAEEIQAMVSAEAQRIVDTRIPGLQSAYEKQIAQLRRDLKKAQSDPDGYTGSSRDSQLEAELAQARREADALRAGRQYPDAFPVYETLMAADSVEDQLDILQKFVRGVPQAPPPPAPGIPAAPLAPEAPVPPVDLNRPLDQGPASGSGMTREVAESIFDRIGLTWPKF